MCLPVERRVCFEQSATIGGAWWKSDGNDKNKRAGIVWCEDQKDLALIDETALAASGAGHLTPGDQFYFREKWDAGVRCVDRIEQFFETGSSMEAGNLAEYLKSSPLRDTKPHLYWVQ